MDPHVESEESPKAQAKPVVDLQFDWEIVKGKIEDQRLSPAELIVLLLDAGKVSGRTMMQKQVFLSYVEVLPKSRTVNPGFRPDRFGPFSQVVADMLISMRLRGLVRVQSKGEGHSTYTLGPNGRAVVERLRKQPGVEKFRSALAKRKIAWDEWSAHGIMRYVYRKYPEYATATAIPHLRWE